MRCKWNFVPDYEDTLNSNPPLKFRCQVCRRETEIRHGDSAELLARMDDCTGRPEDSPPAFRLRTRVRALVLSMKRYAGWGC